MRQRFLSPDQVANKLGISNKTVYKWLNERRLKGAKMGHLWRIDAGDLQQFIDEAYMRARVKDDSEGGDL